MFSFMSADRTLAACPGLQTWKDLSLLGKIGALAPRGGAQIVDVHDSEASISDCCFQVGGGMFLRLVALDGVAHSSIRPSDSCPS